MSVRIGVAERSIRIAAATDIPDQNAKISGIEILKDAD